LQITSPKTTLKNVEEDDIGIDIDDVDIEEGSNIDDLQRSEAPLEVPDEKLLDLWTKLQDLLRNQAKEESQKAKEEIKRLKT